MTRIELSLADIKDIEEAMDDPSLSDKHRTKLLVIRMHSDGEMIAMVRRERGNYFGWIGSSKPPYREWRWHETEHRFGGPNFIVPPDSSLIAAGRSYRQPFSTVIASMDREHYDIALKLPSGGSDTGYAGMVWHKDELWVSYYSSHEDKDGNPPPNRHVELPCAI